MAKHRQPRLYIDGRLAPGGAVELDTGQAHYLRIGAAARSPMRRSPAFNAATGSGCAASPRSARTGARLTVERQLRSPEPEPDLWLLFAPIKRARLDWLVEKATELGVAALLPVWTARTQSGAPQPRTVARACDRGGRAERASFGARDCGRPDALDRVLAAWPAERPLIVCDESGGGEPIADALARLSGRHRWRFLSGRRAGSTETELDALGQTLHLLLVSGSARGCCAPRPPLLRPWRSFRRSPVIGAARRPR